MHNASCFFLQIGSRKFGVTAYHVLAQFVEDTKAVAGLEARIGNTEISDWPVRQIGGDRGLDVATFEISDREFASIGIRAFQNSPANWPRKPPDKNRGVIFTGYPGVDRRVLSRKSVEFLQQSNAVIATSTGPQEIEIQIARKNLRPIIGDTVPSIMKDLGGYSGAPVLVISAGVAEPFWIGGIVINQIPALSEEDVVTIIARRIDCIKPDGSLRTSEYVVD
jgi:hypothetical protein